MADSSVQLPYLLALTRGKTTQACDRCRQRKSRCDGTRPCCGHCMDSGAVCRYRPTPTNLETDQSVLSRLADVEGRLRALEDERASSGEGAMKRARLSVPGEPGHLSHSQLQPSQSHRLNQLQSPQPDHLDQIQPYQPQQPSKRVESSDKNIRLGDPPVVHTASTCQMLHSWPRLRVCLDNDVDPLDLLRQTDHENPIKPEDSLGNCEFDYDEPLEAFYCDLPRLPLAIRLLFETSPWLCKQALDKQLRKHQYKILSVEGLESLDIASWIVLSMALRIFDNPKPGPDATGKDGGQWELKASGVPRAARACLWYALNRRKNTHELPYPDCVALPLALAYSLTYFWARPLQALELLHGIDTKIKRWATRAPDDPVLINCCKLYSLLENDILTEVDEYSVETILFQKSPAYTILQAKPELLSVKTMSHVATNINHLVVLRGFTNQILHLYTPENAYARPRDLLDIQHEIGRKLSSWYLLHLPEKKPFTIKPSPLKAAQLMDTDQVDLAIRYFANVFLIHRPVLYFFLHQDLEDAIQPSNRQTGDIDPLWSSAECVEHAIILIYTSCASFQPLARNWCDYQLLLAAYLVVLQTKDLPALSPVFAKVGEPSHVVMQRVEMLFQKSANGNPLIKQSLEIMEVLRQRFGRSPSSHRMLASA